MLDLERDVQIVEGMAVDLKTYLLSDGLYWPITSRGLIRRPLIKGTLGAMLIRFHQLGVLRADLTPGQQARVDAAFRQADAEMRHWLVQTEQRAMREIRARVRQWFIYVDELEDRPRFFMGEYPMQATSRTTIAFLQQAAGRAIEGSSALTRLIIADRKLLKLVQQADFVLDPQLQPAYPRRPYWWLHVWPVDPDED